MPEVPAFDAVASRAVVAAPCAAQAGATQRSAARDPHFDHEIVEVGHGHGSLGASAVVATFADRKNVSTLPQSRYAGSDR